MYYKKRLELIHNELLDKAALICPDLPISLKLNTKDFADRTYLTAFGTSTDKGDCGAVGRGNRYNGIIAPNREMSIEAPSGKNPTYHVGKLYNELAFRITRDVYQQCGLENYVNIVSRNGDELCSPALIFIKCIGDSMPSENCIRDIVQSHLEVIPELTLQIVHSDPIADHVNRPRQLYTM
jgi:S-adenosylmethionine synthetase